MTKRKDLHQQVYLSGAEQVWRWQVMAHRYSDNCTCSECHGAWMNALFAAIDREEKKKPKKKRRKS